MNAGIGTEHPSIYYYDGDYPSQFNAIFPENFDEVTKFQGLAHDVSRYKEIVTEAGGSVLELCCGTGRVAIPLARGGARITGVDISSGLLDQFKANLKREPAQVAENITLVEQDITRLDLAEKNFKVAIVAFNSLLCVTRFEEQLSALHAIRNHVTQGGLLVLDIVNPLRLKIEGDPVPKPFFTRRNPHNGNTYTRFAMVDAFDENHRQRLHGWYDEIDESGAVRRKLYSVYWRPIFRFELELMLKDAGFDLIKIEGGHQGEPYTAQSPRMFVQARRR